MYRMLFHAAVVKDISQAVLWYEQHSITATNNFKQAVKSALENILSSPLIFRKIYKEIRVYHLKKFPFSIYYFVEDEIIYIISIFHTSRNPDVWKERAE